MTLKGTGTEARLAYLESYREFSIHMKIDLVKSVGYGQDAAGSQDVLFEAPTQSSERLANAFTPPAVVGLEMAQCGGFDLT